MAEFFKLHTNSTKRKKMCCELTAKKKPWNEQKIHIYVPDLD